MAVDKRPIAIDRADTIGIAIQRDAYIRLVRDNRIAERLPCSRESAPG